jgi:hypothetical protein
VRLVKQEPGTFAGGELAKEGRRKGRGCYGINGRRRVTIQPLSPKPIFTYQRRRVRDKVQEGGEALADERQNHKDFRKINGGAHLSGGCLDRITVKCGGAAALVEGVKGGCGLLGTQEDGGTEGEVI